METFKVEILGCGTSQGVPVIACGCEVCQSSDPKDKRSRSSIWIHNEKTSIIVDAGPDFRQQMLRHQVNRVDAVVITHGHADHIMGLDDLRTYNFLQNSSIPVYAYADTLSDLKRKFDYAFGHSDYPGVPNLEAIIVKEKAFVIGELEIHPIAVDHGNQKVLGIRIADFAYITDANYISEVARSQLSGINVLILNALRRESHHSHFTLNEAVNIMKELRVERGYLTHISHLMGRHEEVERELPKHVHLAHDGLVIKIDA